MKKLLIAVAMLSLVATQAEARDGWHGHHGGGGHDFFFAASLMTLLALPFYYTTVRAEPGPYVYPSTTVYVQNPPTYVVANPSQSYVTVANAPAAVYTPPQSSGVIELGPVTATPVARVAASQPSNSTWFVYPSKGQSAELQASDRSECGSWAAGQTGMDSNTPSANGARGSPADYGRALSACLEGRGYTVR